MKTTIGYAVCSCDDGSHEYPDREKVPTAALEDARSSQTYYLNPDALHIVEVVTTVRVVHDHEGTQTCIRCAGTGQTGPTRPADCPTCEGTGAVAS